MTLQSGLAPASGIPGLGGTFLRSWQMGGILRATCAPHSPQPSPELVSLTSVSPSVKLCQ